MIDGLKQRDLEPCILCDKGVMHAGDPVVYRISIQQFVFNVRAIQRQHGLEMSMGDAAPLAQIMGPNDDLAKATGKPLTGLLCAPCAMTATTPLQVWSAIAERSERSEGTKG